MVVVFAIAAAAFFMFVVEVFPPHVTAFIVMTSLIVLGPWTGISPSEGISGFSNDATITVLAMLVLSYGVSQTGAVQKLGERMASFAGTDQRKQLGATLAFAGLPSAVLNNTPIVAMLIPVVSDVADRGRTSPSKLLIPLSYGAMVGGMLTLIGTSTNLIASNVAGRLGGQYPSLHAYSMFEFTKLGIIVFVVGTVYLMTVGQRLIPERVLPTETILEEYDLEPYLAEVLVDEDSSFVGRTVGDTMEGIELDADIVSLVRGEGTFLEPLAGNTVRPGDVLVVRADFPTLRRLMTSQGLSFSTDNVTEAALAPDREGETLIELVLPSWSSLTGETLESAAFRQTYDTNVLAVRRGSELLHEWMDRTPLRRGDTLVIQASEEIVDRLATERDFIVTAMPADPNYRESKIPVAIAIVAGVVGLAATGRFDILTTALSGVVAMILTGVVRPNELYEAVEWDVIFLLAGLIPLGIAFEGTGAAASVGSLVATSAGFLPAVGVLWVVYVITTLVTAVVSNSASVILMIPVAANAAAEMGLDPYAFVLAVTFAASADFMTPIGYQTNLLVYGPGGYRFTDYFRVGAPLQLLLSIATVGGIVLFWGV
ncbi:citrate transporter [Halalkalicoccus paucihalophilus]|uniref:Citrate transporter n=2 Tax=Halalkalicoccus paucihalophilus TaxID=1008153 RepID=A0A151ABN6_9EURY|nr:SLC13 family permease [Halalkalicoccus paucihalophilus]KYH25004.1 citrate transporter [Halalkalicoccus paucihalophilus]